MLNCSDDELSSAALHNLWPLPNPNGQFPKPEAELARAQEWIDTKRAWLLTLSDEPVRRAYEGWIEHVERGLAENRIENETHAKALARAAWLASDQQEMERAHSIANQIPKP